MNVGQTFQSAHPSITQRKLESLRHMAYASNHLRNVAISTGSGGPELRTR